MVQTKKTINLIKVSKQACLIALVSALALSGAGWPTFRGNASRTAYYPDRVGFPGDKPIWTFKTRAAIISSPSVVDGVVYFGSRDSTFYALSAGNGRVKWWFSTNGWVDASPHVEQNMVLFGSRDEYLYAINADNGRARSRAAAGLQAFLAQLRQAFVSAEQESGRKDYIPTPVQTAFPVVSEASQGYARCPG